MPDTDFKRPRHPSAYAGNQRRAQQTRLRDEDGFAERLYLKQAGNGSRTKRNRPVTLAPVRGLED